MSLLTFQHIRSVLIVVKPVHNLMSNCFHKLLFGVLRVIFFFFLIMSVYRLSYNHRDCLARAQTCWPILILFCLWRYFDRILSCLFIYFYYQSKNLEWLPENKKNEKKRKMKKSYYFLKIIHSNLDQILL